MPDETGRLTQDDHAKIRNWWVGRWNAPVVCPVCKSTEWQVGDHVAVLHRHAHDYLRPGSAAYPMFTVSCTTCAHTMLFSAVMAGITAHYNPMADSVFSNLLPAPRSG